LRWLALAVALGGCGRISFDALSAPRDGENNGGDARKFFIDAGECPPNYTFDTMGCYRAYAVSSAPKAWLEAEAECEADAYGSHLAVISSAAEVAVIDRQQPGTIIDHWIGMTDIVTDGAYMNVDSTGAVYVNWAAGQPLDLDDCVLFNDDQTLATAPCSKGDDYVCEYDGIVPVPASWGQ
jgi:hypothetical protein